MNVISSAALTAILVPPVVLPLVNTSDKVSLPKSTISAIVAFLIVLGPLISLNHRVSVATGTAVFSTAIALSVPDTSIAVVKVSPDNEVVIPLPAANTAVSRVVMLDVVELSDIIQY